jgi:hypothetical protein
MTPVELLLNQFGVLARLQRFASRKDLSDARRAVLFRAANVDAHVVRAARSVEALVRGGDGPQQRVDRLLERTVAVGLQNCRIACRQHGAAPIVLAVVATAAQSDIKIAVVEASRVQRVVTAVLARRKAQARLKRHVLLTAVLLRQSRA